MIIRLLTSVLIAVEVWLILIEALAPGPFRHLTCDCKLNNDRRMAQTIWCLIWIWYSQHYRTSMLAVEAFVLTLVPVLFLVDDYSKSNFHILSVFIDCVILVQGVWYIGRWHYHSKAGRDKLKDKVLGRVKVTLAGLKVVPEHG